MNELKKRIKDLYYAIQATETAFRYCSTPSLKDLYLQNIDHYKREIVLAETELLSYTETSIKEQ